MDIWQRDHGQASSHSSSLVVEGCIRKLQPDAPRAVLAEAELELFLQDIESKQFPMPADAPEDVLESLVEEDADLSAEVMDVLNESKSRIYKFT